MLIKLSDDAGDAGEGGDDADYSDSSCVADPDPYVLGLLDPDPLVRGTDPDPSIIKQK
jgi:hypothetical protein